MNFKLLWFYLLVLCWYPYGANAQSTEEIGLICLNPYVPETEILDAKTASVLNGKLLQIATANGMSGAGFDNRFIITAHVQKIKSVQTQTYPQKNAVDVVISIYVGDGLDGTLFSSYSCEKKGVGDSESQALASAINKVNPYQQDLQMAIEKGKKQILDYYSRMSSSIISAAKATAAKGKYDDAMSMLFAIPIYNKDFQVAQNLIAQYGTTSLDNKNLDVVRQARSAWSSDPTENGASEALEVLEKLDAPSSKVRAEAEKLQNEMSARLKAVSDREFKLRIQKVQNAKDVKLAAIRAASSVAKAYAASRPKVIYRYLWW